MFQSTLSLSRGRGMVAASALLVLGALSISSCSAGRSGSTPTPGAVSPDPRVGLRAGRTNPGEASWNMRLVAHRPTPPGAAGAWNSDLAFQRNFVLQGNYNGFVVWD